MGCFRSLPEVIGWNDYDNLSRKRVLEDANTRRQAHIEKYEALNR